MVLSLKTAHNQQEPSLTLFEILQDRQDDGKNITLSTKKLKSCFGLNSEAAF